MADLNENHKQFLENPYYAVVTTLREDGSPHNTVVWVETVDGNPSFNTAYPRTKPRHLEHDPRVALTVIDPADPFKWISVSGTAELTTDGADDQIDRLSGKYTGNPRYQGHSEEEQRVSVRIKPDKVTAVGLD
jgi:PPOX class probable F420-dependent enzyme